MSITYMKEIKTPLSNNQAWLDRINEKDPKFFERLA